MTTWWFKRAKTMIRAALRANNVKGRCEITSSRYFTDDVIVKVNGEYYGIYNMYRETFID